jgi:hypothetical protein
VSLSNERESHLQNDPAAPVPWNHKVTEEMEEALFALKVGGKPFSV